MLSNVFEPTCIVVSMGYLLIKKKFIFDGLLNRRMWYVFYDTSVLQEFT